MKQKKELIILLASSFSNDYRHIAKNSFRVSDSVTRLGEISITG
jgi:hypothetical protein